MLKSIQILTLFTIALFAVYFVSNIKSQQKFQTYNTDNSGNLEEKGEVASSPYPLSIEYMRTQEYPGSEMIIEETLKPGSNYRRYIASYKSQGLKIYGLLTIPDGQLLKSGSPVGEAGWPVIIFNHGYIAPSEYRTTERYVAYADAFSRNGYIVFKSDYRGHGDSEGSATGGYGSPAYTIDILNAVSSIKRLKDPSNANSQVLIVNSDRIGMWGHSMGGFITLRSMVISKDIKAGVIWGGVVASYPDLISRWRRGSTTPIPLPTGARRWRDLLTAQFGSPEKNPSFWNSISANSYLNDLSGQIQLHHGTEDQSVPIEFSQKLEKELKSAGKIVEFYSYPGDDHNITANFNIAIKRSVEFFDKYLKI